MFEEVMVKNFIEPFKQDELKKNTQAYRSQTAENSR